MPRQPPDPGIIFAPDIEASIVVVRGRSRLSGAGAPAVSRCHESVTCRYVRPWTGSDIYARKALRINKYRVQGRSGESTSRDLKFAQCRFESDWGHQSPYGSRVLDRDSAFRVVAWTSAAHHRFEWTTEAADFRSAREPSSFGTASWRTCSSGLVDVINRRLRVRLDVTRLSQLDLAELTDLVDTRDRSGQPHSRDAINSYVDALVLAAPQILLSTQDVRRSDAQASG